MAKAYLRSCKHIGCANPAEKYGYCDEHLPERYKNSNRENFRQRGYGTKWSKTAAMYTRAHPTCEQCKYENRVRAKDIVHHIIPEQLCMKVNRQDLIYNHKNLKSVCSPCHGKESVMDALWFEFAESNSMLGSIEDLFSRFIEWLGRYKQIHLDSVRHTFKRGIGG